MNGGWTGSHVEWVITITYDTEKKRKVIEYSTTPYECCTNTIHEHIERVGEKGFFDGDGQYVLPHRIVGVHFRMKGDDE